MTFYYSYKGHVVNSACPLFIKDGKTIELILGTGRETYYVRAKNENGNNNLQLHSAVSGGRMA